MFATPPRQKQRSKAFARHAAAVSALDLRKVDLSIRSAGATVAVSCLGEGPIVMLVHGWGGSAADMLPMATAFARAGYQSVVFDMPGHGRSSGRESSIVEFLRTMRTVADTLGQPELIVGHSFGAAATIFGITELGLPVRGAILVSPAAGPGYYVDRFARAVGLPSARTDGMVRQLVHRVGRSLESLDAVVAARRATVPSLVFHDPADREVPFESSARISDAWNGSHLIEAPSLGHKRILRDPAVIARAVNFGVSLRP